MDQTKTEYSSRFQIALLTFGFGLVEAHVHSGGIYLEEVEPAQIFITVDGSWNSRCRLASNSWTLIDSLILWKSLTFVDSRSCLARALRTVSLSPDRNIGNNVLRYFLKINVTSSSLSMHVNYTTRTVAERSLSLLTRINKVFRSQDIPADWISNIYVMILSSVFSVCLIL